MCRGAGPAQPRPGRPTSTPSPTHTLALCFFSVWARARARGLHVIGQLRLGQLGPKKACSICAVCLTREGEALDGLGGGDRHSEARTAPSWAWKPSCSPAPQEVPQPQPQLLHRRGLCTCLGACQEPSWSFLCPRALSPRESHCRQDSGFSFRCRGPLEDHRLVLRGESSGNGTRSLEQAEAALLGGLGPSGWGTHRWQSHPGWQ